ncbi:hypothetical protein CN495_08240 [Bacillus thuringiensis]|uniref:ASCH domain-containing protein n=1 Tax=Bacillus thuringiensis TaxID=1428 RepID=A0ABD6S7C0_BACTU|nr:hypothetical protein [Bacillus thuringiensis]PER55733.1 hypothetical protein CN495_08240 [Bacillus thuringiensis]
MKQTILNLINSNPHYVERAWDAMCKGKVFVLVNEGRIVAFTRTNMGAESYVKSWTNHYYDFDTKETVQIKAPLQIVEFLACEVVGYVPEE